MFPASDWYHENFRENITSNILLDLTIFHLTSILYKPKWLSCKRLINLKESRVKQIATTLSNPNIALIKFLQYTNRGYRSFSCWKSKESIYQKQENQYPLELEPFEFLPERLSLIALKNC